MDTHAQEPNSVAAILQLSDRDVWEQVIEPGEKLLWSGRPAPGYRMRRGEWALLIVIAGGNLGIAVFGIHTMLNAPHAPTWAYFWLGFMGLLGAGLIPLRLVKLKYERAKTRYALTDRRAMILNIGLPSRLRAFPREQTNDLEVSRYGDGLSIVFFKLERVFGQHTHIGFEFIERGDALKVLMQHHQYGKGPTLSGRTMPQRADIEAA